MRPKIVRKKRIFRVEGGRLFHIAVGGVELWGFGIRGEVSREKTRVIKCGENSEN